MLFVARVPQWLLTHVKSLLLLRCVLARPVLSRDISAAQQSLESVHSTRVSTRARHAPKVIVLRPQVHSRPHSLPLVFSCLAEQRLSACYR